MSLIESFIICEMIGFTSPASLRLLTAILHSLSSWKSFLDLCFCNCSCMLVMVKQMSQQQDCLCFSVAFFNCGISFFSNSLKLVSLSARLPFSSSIPSIPLLEISMRRSLIDISRISLPTNSPFIFSVSFMFGDCLTCSCCFTNWIISSSRDLLSFFFLFWAIVYFKTSLSPSKNFRRLHSPCSNLF